MMGTMAERKRDLILASEIAAILHDLGKLRPEFAKENFAGGRSYRSRLNDVHIHSAHGAILEKEKRPYPPADSKGDWLDLLKEHDGWKQVLKIQPEWLCAGSAAKVQAHGLGDPLREHHGEGLPDFTLLGTLFSVGADIRDSALDKSAEGKGSGRQRGQCAFIADALGNEHLPYSAACLETQWAEAKKTIEATLFKDSPWNNVPQTRQRFVAAIEPIFRKALGVTLRPVNDVTLWHHSYATASLHKALVAEGVLREDFRAWQDQEGLSDLGVIGRIRFRLLAIRWDWAGLARTVLEPVVLSALAERRADALAALRQRLEIAYPVGNAVYEDDDGVVFVAPGFYEGHEKEDRERSERLFEKHVIEPVLGGLDQDLKSLGAGTEVRLAWTVPRLYLTDFAEVMGARYTGGERERLYQVNETDLKAQWRRARTPAICPNCGLRPGRAVERGVSEATLDSWRKSYCATCADLANLHSKDRRTSTAGKQLGFHPRTFNLGKVREERGGPDNPRLALLSIQTDPVAIASGAVFATQVARPLCDIRKAVAEAGKKAIHLELNDFASIAEYLKAALTTLRTGRIPECVKEIRQLIGDKRWMDANDGRILEGDTAARALRLVDEFFLRESVPEELLGENCDDHAAQRLALFALRKHVSPGRLQRVWDSLLTAWQELLEYVANRTQGYAVPLSLDARGFRVALAAADLRGALSGLRESIPLRFARLYGRFPLHMSVTVFREKFPFYIALDALRRMEARIAVQPAEAWTLAEKVERGCHWVLRLQTDRGSMVSWDIPRTCADTTIKDVWYPYFIRLSDAAGPNRLVHVEALQSGDRIQVRPMTFDYAVLEGSARRYELHYGADGRRPHYILGRPGRRPYLLEDIEDLFGLAGQTGWTPSQAKSIVGALVGCYEQWVRDAPARLRETGRTAWLEHSRRILDRALDGKPKVRERLVGHLEDGLFFDTFEWNEFIEKGATATSGHVVAGAKEVR